MLSKLLVHKKQTAPVIVSRSNAQKFDTTPTVKSRTLACLLGKKKSAQNTGFIDKYVFALHEAMKDKNRISAYCLADIQACAELALGVKVSMSDIETIISTHQHMAHKAELYFENLNHSQALSLLDAAEDAKEFAGAMVKERAQFIAQLEFIFQQNYGALRV